MQPALDEMGGAAGTMGIDRFLQLQVPSWDRSIGLVCNQRLLQSEQAEFLAREYCRLACEGHRSIME